MRAPAVILRRALPRRTFLKAAGIALGLPLLDAMCPALAWAGDGAKASATPHRFIGILTNMGILPDFFFPKKSGANYESTPYLDLLNEHRQAFTVLSGVSLPGVDGGHAAERCFLTGAPGASRSSFRNSVSLDQVMAEQIGATSRFPSLTLLAGNEEIGLSYTRSGAMIPPLRNAVALYQKLFVEDSPEARLAAHQRLKTDRSLLDSLRERTKALERTIGAGDKQQLDQYFSAIRDLEKTLAANEGWIDKPKPKTTDKQPDDLGDEQRVITHMRLMLQMARLAFDSDATRVITLCLSTGGSTPLEIGVTKPVHGLTHHGGLPDVIAALRRVEEAQFKELNAFLTGLRSVKQGGKTLLDQTAVLYGTNMGSANAHSNDNLPVLLAGGGFKHVGHLAFDRKKNHPLTNLHVSLLQRMGVEASSFSTGKEPMPGLAMT